MYARFLGLLVLAATTLPSAAQSMAEAAAKERERREKQQQGKPAPPVYTNDDLAKAS